MTPQRQTFVTQITTQTRKVTGSKTASIALTILFLTLTAMVWNWQSAKAGAGNIISFVKPTSASVLSTTAVPPAPVKPTTNFGATVAPSAQGNGRVTVTQITPNPSCLAGTQQNAGTFNWEVVQGGTYGMTITGVTECSGPSIKVFIQSTPTGNFCLIANLISDPLTSPRIYAVSQFTMPNPACLTYPISYKCDANQDCDNANTFDARGPNGEDKVHLRANNFSNGCATYGEDKDCITVTPTPPPICSVLQITCPTDISQSNDLGACGAVVSYAVPTATGGCPPVSVVCVPNTGSNFPVGTTSVTCTATDSQATPTVVTCSFNVTVTDSERPTIACPTVEPACNTAGQCGAIVTYATPTVSDNCAGVGAPTCSPASGTFFTRGVTEVTCKVKDAIGNEAVCSFNVTVNDCEDPQLVCPTQPVVACNTPGQCDAAVNFTVSASDNCPGVTYSCTRASGASFPVGTTPVTCTATDASGRTATCTFNVTVNDCEAPKLTCPAQPIVVCNTPGQCAANVNVPVSATDNCPGVALNCTRDLSAPFPIGTTSVSCTATDAAGLTATCNFAVTVNDCTTGSVSGKKFYDANANGQDDDGQVVAGWKVTLTGPVNLTQFTNGSGAYSFTNLPSGSYTVTEVMAGASWVATTPTSYSFTVSCNNASNNYTRNFGNYCKTPSGGKTIGFWGNKNGQALITAADLAALSALNLVNANGTPFDPTSAAQLNTWLQAATAVNMSYMLSAQLAAMTLNLRKNFVMGNALDLCSGLTVGNLVNAANAALGADGYTPSGDPNRAPQEALKNCIDALNNNGPVVSATPCPFTSPY